MYNPNQFNQFNPPFNVNNMNNNFNMNQQNTADRGIAINNGSNIDASQSQRPQLGEY